MIGVTNTLSLTIPVVSIAMAVGDPQRRALHDRVAGTRVVQARECVRGARRGVPGPLAATSSG